MFFGRSHCSWLHSGFGLAMTGDPHLTGASMDLKHTYHHLSNLESAISSLNMSRILNSVTKNNPLIECCSYTCYTCRMPIPFPDLKRSLSAIWTGIPFRDVIYRRPQYDIFYHLIIYPYISQDTLSLYHHKMLRFHGSVSQMFNRCKWTP